MKLPEIENEKLAACTPAELIDIMVTHEDRVPRTVIDECVRRGEQMLDSLAPFAQPDDEKEEENPGYWWLRLHAAMILGLIPGESAGRLLVAFVHGMNREEDYDLQDWFSGHWSALLRNKPASVITLLSDICTNTKNYWYMRANITEAVLAGAYQQGGEALEQTLDWAAQCVADEEEDWDYRFSTANSLLHYPRERYRELLMKFSDREHGLAAYYTDDDIEEAYARGTDIPILDGFDNPWHFYAQDQIEWREHRCQKEEQQSEPRYSHDIDDVSFNKMLDYPQATYRRETPKIGRNDPCPCGSGKKYKKCCLGKA